METTNEKPSIFDGFVRNTIIFYLLLILVGYLSILSYYKLFGVNISEYFGIEDYIDIFFNNLFLLILFSMLNIIALLIARNHSQKQRARRIVLFPKVEERIAYLEKENKKGDILEKTDKLTTPRRFKLTTLGRSKLTTPRRSKLTT
jgi:hypothetical protein